MEKPYPYIKPDGQEHVPRVRCRAIPGGADAESVRSRNEAELPPPLLIVQDLALLLATSSSGVYSRVARGQIPGTPRIGRSLRFDPRVIAQWLSAKGAILQYYIYAENANAGMFSPQRAEHEFHTSIASNVSPSAGSIVINELLAENKNNQKDEYNEGEDWLEIYNTSGQTINMSSVYLSNSKLTPLK